MNKYIVILAFIVFFCAGLPMHAQSLEKKGEVHMQCQLIQKITMGHCARGFSNCALCREAYTRKYCLLDICPKGDFARPTIEVEIDGEKTWKPYDIKKIFAHYDEAQTYAQEHHIPFVQDKMTLEDDAVLGKLKNRLPAHWTMTIENEKLIIESSQPVTITFTNRLNAPPPMVTNPSTQGQQGTAANPAGKQVNQRFVFRLESRWYPERLDKIKKSNQAVYDEIDGLPGKLGISHLYRPMSKTEEGIFRPKTAEEQAQVKKYWQERDILLKKLAPLPNYLSGKYALFFVETIGMPDAFTEVQPAAAVKEMIEIEKIFPGVLETPR